MDAETFKEIALTNQWTAIWPEICLGLLALSLLALEVVLPKSSRKLIPWTAIGGQIIILAVLLFGLATGLTRAGEETFAGLLAHSVFGETMRVFFLVSSLLVSQLALVVLPKHAVPRVEFFHILLVATAALMLLVQSNHFVMLFVALETVTVGLYVLVAYFRTQTLSLEAGLKYLILSGVSSALLLFGIVLLYGAGGNPDLPGATAQSMHFPSLQAFLEQNPDHFMATVGMLMVFAGLAFKIAAFPFQIWVPDVYQGAPTPVTAFLAVSSKAAGFVVLLMLVTGVFSPLSSISIPVLSLLAVLTILFGNIAALTQRNVKRLMGLSGIAHAGYLLVGVIASFTVPWAAGAVLFYLVTYLLGSFAVFGVMAQMAGENDAVQNIEDYEELAKERPFLGGVLAVGLGSLAGIPPLAGFIGKLLIFIAAFQAGLFGLLAVSVIGVVISIYYYFGWIRIAYFRFWKIPAEEGEERETGVWPEVSLSSRVVMAGLALLTILLGFYQGPLSAWLTGL